MSHSKETNKGESFGYVQTGEPVTSTVTVGSEAEAVALAGSYKSEWNWEDNTVTWHEVSYSTGQPVSTVTVKTGTSALPKEGDWREPIPLGYGFYMCGTDTNADEDYIKIHEPWKPDTVDGNAMFRYCGWLTEWNFPMPMLENGSYMFAYTYMRKFRDPSEFGTSLSRLVNGDYMFILCSLDAESVRIIAEQIKDWRGDTATHKLSLGIDQAYRDEVGGYIDAITAKGWTVTVAYTNFYSA